MRVLGFVVVAFFLILGVIGLFAPDRLLAAGRFTTSPTGMYVGAAVRIAIGVTLLTVASHSRFHNTLRLFGLLAILGGFVTLALGSDRLKAIADWAATYGSTGPRVFGVFALLIGGFIAYAISDRDLFPGRHRHRTA